MKWEGKDKGGAGCYGQALFDLPIRRIIIFRYNISYGELPDGLDFSGSDEESIPPENGNGSGGQAQRSSSSSVRRKMSASSRRSSSFNISQEKVTCYRWVSWHRGGLSQGGPQLYQTCLTVLNAQQLEALGPYLLRPPWLASWESFTMTNIFSHQVRFRWTGHKPLPMGHYWRYLEGLKKWLQYGGFRCL